MWALCPGVHYQIEPECLGEVSESDVPSVHDSSLESGFRTVSRADALTELAGGDHDQPQFSTSRPAARGSSRDAKGERT